MKGKIVLLLSTFFVCHNVQAQTLNKSVGKHSALTKQYLSIVNSPDKNAADAKFVHSRIDGQKYVSAFVKINEQLQAGDFEDLGILVGTKAGNVWTVKIPVGKMQAFTALESGIDFVQLDSPVSPTLEEARAATNVDEVHQGLDLPQAFTGKDVVMGILDVGFDYTHPTFYDTLGTNYRIKRIWEQKSVGLPPAGYAYGHEFRDTEDMIEAETDNANESHGAHVAGIAAGSGFGGDGDEYRGVAYESDLVFVGITPPQEQWQNTGMTDLVDGINYVFEYADAQGKPAVANLSWGCSIGPHDGSSLFSQAVNNLTGPGKIFTISGGNNGEQNLHLRKQFSATDSLLQSFVRFNTNLGEDKTWIDIWGDTGENFCIQLGTYEGQSVNALTDFMCIEDTTMDTMLIGSDSDTLFVQLSTVSSDVNGKPHAFLDIHSKTNDNISLAIKGSSGEVNVWMGYIFGSRGYYGEFVTNGLPGATVGDDVMTVGEMACTESAIAVGAYASKVSFINLADQSLSYSNYVDPNHICPFSSKGPTVDGRMKPDITAPGMTIASSVNSFDSEYLDDGSDYDFIVHQFTDETTDQVYNYAENSGTSMAAPMVAGIVALCLEANPHATPAELITLLGETAIKDIYTTDNPDPDVWGYGKVDAHAMLQTIPVSVQDHYVSTHDLVYPNPTSDQLNLNVPGDKVITIINSLGQTCRRLLTSDPSISLQHLAPGIYHLNLHSLDGRLILERKVVKH